MKDAGSLGQWLSWQREAAGFSIYGLAKSTGLNAGTIWRIEQGVVAAPAPDKLARIADALQLDLADVFAMADYATPRRMPTFRPYLHSRYPAIPAEAVKELERYFGELADRYGFDPIGPAPGEDEAPHAPAHKN